MPVIKSAKKKLRADKKRTIQNKGVKNLVKELVKKAKASKSEKAVIEAVVAIDKATKKNIFHKNKAARFKSTLSKLLSKKESSPKKTEEKKPKTVVKKTSKKPSVKAKK
jgi:small subunit ribosomal protein S20